MTGNQFFCRVLDTWTRYQKKRPSRRSRYTQKLVLESLEDRIAPAEITGNVVSDDGRAAGVNRGNWREKRAYEE